MHDLVIYGAGGLGREVAEIVDRINAKHRFWNFIGFVDDVISGTVWRERAVLGGIDFIRNYEKPLDVVLSIADPETKKAIYSALKALSHVCFPNVIDVCSEIASRIHFEEGVVISHMCSLSVDVKLGRCVFINTGSHIGHDSVIGDFCSVMSSVNVSGNVTVGECTMIGVGASILQGLAIGSRSVVGMGSIVLSNVPDCCTVLGNPARKF